MLKVYVRITGFYIHDPRVKMNDQLMYTLRNNETGTEKTFKFTLKEASSIKRSYHIDILDFQRHTFSITLSKQTGFFSRAPLGTINIPTFMLPIDQVNYNHLYLNIGNMVNPSIVLKCIFHVVQNSIPYKGQIVRSVFPQACIDDLMNSINTNINANDEDCPLLL